MSKTWIGDRASRLRRLGLAATAGVGVLWGVDVLTVFITVLWAAPVSALTITKNPDIAAGQASFGPAVTLFNWTDFFGPGVTWSFGNRFPTTGAGTDPVTGNIVTPELDSNINIGNWIDGDGFIPSGVGFNDAGGAAAPELALGNAENFRFNLTDAVNTVGFAVATGLGNYSFEIDDFGASFDVTTDTGEQGTLTLVDTGQGYSAWITIESTVPFHQLTFIEISPNIKDQYFGNIFTPSAPPSCPLTITIGDTETGTVVDLGPLDPGLTRDLVRGDLNTLRSTGGDFTAALDAIIPSDNVCMADNVAAASVADTMADPPAGAAWFYLARCLAATYDSGSTHQQGQRDAEIAAAAGACP